MVYILYYQFAKCLYHFNCKKKWCFSLGVQIFDNVLLVIDNSHKPWLLEILGNRELRQDQQAPVDRAKICRLGFMSHDFKTHYKRKIDWMNWIQSGNYDTHRWTSRTGQAIISTSTLKSKKTG